jgi:ParB family chromosome partitioning protein
LIAGERRLRASEMAGLSAVPAVIKDVAADDMLLLALIENIQREDLNPVEEARAFETLLKQRGITQEALAEQLGKDRTTITNSIRLLKLPEYVLTALIEDKLSSGHARAILTLEDKPQVMRGLFQKVIDKGISVRETEVLAKKLKEEVISVKTRESDREDEKDPFTRDAERRLCNRLSTKVEIAKSKSGAGKIYINFSSDDELNRLFEMLLTVREK